jgi:hypothetical protein
LITLLIAHWFLSPWRCRCYVPSKRRILQESRCITSRKTAFFSHSSEIFIPYIALTGWALYRRHNVFSVRYELRFYIATFTVCGNVTNNSTRVRIGYRISSSLRFTASKQVTIMVNT